jgi:hypothetical protein
MASPPGYEPILQQLVPLVTRWRADPTLELEARLGVYTQRHFVTGVSPPFYQALYDALTDEPSLSQWDSVPVKHSFRYLYYPDNVRGQYNMVDPPVFCRVKRVQVVDVHCHNRHDLRFSLKEERPLPRYHPPKGSPHKIRINTRYSLSDGPWRYDFTKTGMGATTQEACKAFHIFVELEVQQSPALDAHNDREIAINLLGRAVDLLGRYSPVGVEEQLKLALIET